MAGGATTPLAWASRSCFSCTVQATSQEQALQIAFANVGRRLRCAFRTDPAAVGVLHTLAEAGPMRVSALAEALVLDISTTSRHVSTLESEGFVAREVDPADRRACLVDITPAGDDFLQQALRERAAVLESATREWPADDLTSLIDLLDRLADDLTGARHR